MDLTDLDARDLSAWLARREVGPVEVMTAFLDRIEAVNPVLNAIVSLRPRDDLLAEARAAEAAPRRGWLHGIPLAVKDLAATAGLRTTSGSPIHRDFVPDRDDLLVSRLKAAGGIVIGKTNTPEFGLGSHTFNPVFGPTRNPWDRSRTPGGSSGGAAAALAARLLPVADGSDMMGSLRNPAGFCNVYGFRPTWGLVPSEPQGEMFLFQLSTDGPMGRSPADVAALLSTLAGPDPRRPFGRATEPFGLGLDADPAGLRIGWLGDWGGAWPVEDGILELCRGALATFETLGCRVEEVPPPFPADAAWEAWTTLRSWSVASRNAALWRDPANRALLKPAMIWEIERGLAMSAAEVFRASELRSDFYRAMAATFARFDVLVLPTAQVWPFPVDWTFPQTVAGVTMDTYHRWMEVVVPVSLGAFPCLAVPAGFGTGGLPMGLQLFGPQGSDRRLLQLGQAWHRATGFAAERPPEPG